MLDFDDKDLDLEETPPTDIEAIISSILTLAMSVAVLQYQAGT